MPDEAETVPVDETTTNTIVVVPAAASDTPSDDSELAIIRDRLSAIEAWQVAHSETHISDMEAEETETEETGENDDRSDDSGEPEREPAGNIETPADEAIERPIRKGLGGFLFGPIGRKR